MITATDRTAVADALDAYAEGVQENLAEDYRHDPAPDPFPVVADYEADAARIRDGGFPLHAHTWEVLESEFDVRVMADDEPAFVAAVAGLRADAPVVRWIGICPRFTNNQLEAGQHCGAACTCGTATT